MITKNKKISLAIRVIIITLIILLGLILSGFRIQMAHAVTDSQTVYESRIVHSSDGIGKFYMGREIAKVMGHTAALWLERPSRETTEKPQQVVDALNLKSTDTVADIGAGTGYFSLRIAHLVPEGKVLAVDVQPEMIDIINFLKQENKIPNVQPILASVNDPNLLDNTVDVALMVDAYHEFEYPQEVMGKVVRAMKPKGRVVLVEYRGENPFVPIKALHKMTQKQVQKEMNSVGLRWLETKDFLPQQHLMIFEKP